MWTAPVIVAVLLAGCVRVSISGECADGTRIYLMSEWGGGGGLVRELDGLCEKRGGLKK